MAVKCAAVSSANTTMQLTDIRSCVAELTCYGQSHVSFYEAGSAFCSASRKPILVASRYEFAESGVFLTDST